MGLESVPDQVQPPDTAHDEALLLYDGPKPRIMHPALEGDQYAEHLLDAYQVAKAGLTREDWTTGVAYFIRNIDDLSQTPLHGDFALGLLARLFEKSRRLYHDEPEPSATFAFDVFAMVSKLDHLPDSLMAKRETEIGKRKPSFMESLSGTLRRFRFMETLPQIFGALTEGIIVGGSMSYGPFYSVRRGEMTNDASDIDAIFVLREDFERERHWEPVVSSPHLTMADRLGFATRLHGFSALRAAGAVDVISQRFDTPGTDFNMSAHFFPQEVFEAMNVSALQKALQERADTDHIIRDFKPKRFEHPACRQRTFDGTSHEYVVPEQSAVEGGVVAEIPGFMVHGGDLYLGLYQNLISPEFDVLHDSTGTTSAAVAEFKAIVLEEVRAAQAAGKVANVALSHIRHQIFAPGRYDNRASLMPTLVS